VKHIRTAQTAVWLNSCCCSTVLDLSDKSSPSRVVFCDEMPRVRYTRTHTHFGTSGNVRQAYMREKQQFCSNEKLMILYFTVEQLSASRNSTVSVMTMLWVGRSGVRIPAGSNISPKCALWFLDHPVSTVGLIPSRLEQRLRISEAVAAFPSYVFMECLETFIPFTLRAVDRTANKL
jgi:hypothetical protein